MTTRFSYVAPPTALFATLASVSAAAFPGSGGVILELRCLALDGSHGAIREPLAFHADVDGRRDAAVLAGDDVVVLMGPDPTQYSRALGLRGATALASLPGSPSVADRLLVAHDSGLSLVRRNLANPRDFEPVLVPLGGTAWAGARSIVTLDLDGDGDLDVLGLDVTGSNLLSVLQDAGGSFSVAPPVSLGVELSDLVVAPWGVGAPTVAGVLRSNGVADDAVVVLGVDGQLYASYTPGGAVIDLAHVVDGGAGGGALVALGAAQLSVLRAGGIVEPAVGLSAFVPSALAVADYDGDGADDVLLNSTLDVASIVLLNQAPGGVTLRADLPAAVVALEMDQGGGGAAAQLAHPLGADFDRDGDIDVLQFVQSARRAVLVRGTQVDDEALRPGIQNTYWVVDPVSSIGIFDVVLAPLPGGAAPDRLEVVVYTNEPGDAHGTNEAVRASVVEDVVGYNVGDVVPVVVPFPGAPGEETSVTVRGYAVGGNGSTALDCGGETAARYAYPKGAGPRGTIGPARKPGVRQAGNGKTPPPPPPVPVIN